MITGFKSLPGALLRDLVKGRINLYAMSLAYIMLLSLAPLLLGSRIAFYVQFPAALRLDRKVAQAPPDKRLGLNVLWRLMEAFRAGRGPVKDEALAVDPMGSSQRAEATIQALENAGLIVQVNSGVRSWVLARAGHGVDDRGAGGAG
ncbi:MAG TPA: hypothetical protein ENK26_13340 [Gammaproteobacteria bacterium]|nr:hypothetical protein [Gammaproteobacteria bacterium]